MIEQKLYQHQNLSLSYLIGGNPKNQAIILIPPGLGRADYYGQLLKTLSDNYFVVSIDLPGVNKSQSPTNDFIYIANAIVQLIKNIGLKKPIVIGESYGGSIALLVSQKINLNKLVLIAAGEFFTFWQKIILSLIFVPALMSTILRKVYGRTLRLIFRHRPDLLNFSGFNNQQLKIFNQRFIKTLWFRLPKDYHSSTQTLLIQSTADQIISKNSFAKIKNIFVNHTIINPLCSHFDYQKTLQKNNYSDILDFLN